MRQDNRYKNKEWTYQIGSGSVKIRRIVTGGYRVEEYSSFGGPHFIRVARQVRFSVRVGNQRDGALTHRTAKKRAEAMACAQTY